MQGADVRIGDYVYRLAGGEWADLYGVAPLRRVWRSLFAERQDVTGEPGLQNLRPEDLRWAMTSFAGGEGLTALKRGDDEAARRFLDSEGIDFSNPGQFVLSKSLTQRGLTGGASTTIEGTSLVDVVGTSIVVNTDDRELVAVGDVVKSPNFTPAAGTWQAEFFAYISGPQVWEGTADFPNTSWRGTVAVTPSDGSNLIIRKPTPGSISSSPKNVSVADETEATFVLKGLRSDTDSDVPEWIDAQLVVRNELDTLTLAQADVRLDSTLGHFDDFTPFVVNFVPLAADADVIYRLRLVSASDGVDGLVFDKVEQRPVDPKVLKWTVYDETANAEVISGEVDMIGLEESQRVASASWVANGTTAYSLRVERDQGATRRFRVDKVVYSTISMRQPWNLDAGAGDRQWLVDYQAGDDPAMFVWEPGAEEWESVGSFGGVGAKAIAMTSDGVYEYVLLDDLKVYRTKMPLPTTITTWTAAIPAGAGGARTPVGLAVGADRIYVLCMNTLNGVELMEATVDGTAPVTWTARPISVQAVEPDQTLPNQIVATRTGCVFFVNHGTRCIVYEWNAGDLAVERIAQEDTGFKGQAIAHTRGVTFVAGQFMGVDTDSTLNRRPAIIFVEHESFFVDLLDVPLSREDDLDSKVQSIQLFGTDLFVLTQVRTTDAKQMRLWRVSLRDPVGSFLEHELDTDEEQQDWDARALAVNLHTRIVAWGYGSPYIEQETYVQSGRLHTAVYDFGLLESKTLTAIDVDGDFGEPDENGKKPGSLTVGYKADQEGEFVRIATIRRTGRSIVAVPPRFRNLQLEYILRTSDPTATPKIRSVHAKAEMAEFERGWEALLDCTHAIAANRVHNRQVPGSEAADALFSLAASGAVAEAQFYFAVAPGHGEAPSMLVKIETPDGNYIKPGEAIVRVRLKEVA